MATKVSASNPRHASNTMRTVNPIGEQFHFLRVRLYMPIQFGQHLFDSGPDVFRIVILDELALRDWQITGVKNTVKTAGAGSRLCSSARRPTAFARFSA